MCGDHPAVRTEDHLHVHTVARRPGGQVAVISQLGLFWPHRGFHHTLEDVVIRPGSRELRLVLAGAVPVSASSTRPVPVEDVATALRFEILDVDGVAAGESQADAD